MREPALRTNYDDIADVLYVTIGSERPDQYVEDDDGLIWRVNTQGSLYGVTVMDYAEAWVPRRRRLIGRLVEKLSVRRSEAERALSDVSSGVSTRDAEPSA